MSKKNSLQKYDCDRSGFTHRKCDLKRQRGLLVSPDELDDLSKIETPNPRWGTPRENSTTTTAGSSPTIFRVTSSGVTSLRQSQEFREDGVHTHYFMHVVGDSAPTNITTDPQIIAGSDGDRITLYGTSDSNYLILDDGDGLSLILGESMLLKNKDSITLVYTSSDSTWRETSRFKGGI